VLYRWRWLISAVVLAAIVSVAGAGFGRLGTFSAQVDTLREQAPEEVKNKPFDARYDIWFDPDDPGLQLHKRIEDQFSAEDFVPVSFEETEHPLGVFSPKSLSTIAELTERIEKIPFVRRVTGVVTPLVIVMASVIGMLGTVFLMGDLLNNITAGAIDMVTAVSIADSIHLVASYYSLRHKHTNKHELITEVISINAMPVFLTSVTTAIGDKSIIRFMTPAEITGVAALTHEHPDATDDNWLYLPATKRSRCPMNTFSMRSALTA
jgi:predicted RND superfamily exporter protein